MMNLKNELKEELGKYPSNTLSKKELGLFCLCSRAIKALPNEPEKTFVPTEEGEWWWRPDDDHDWKIKHIDSIKPSGELVVVYDQGLEKFSNMEGEWWPDRIPMPGEE